ncbi:MAG TPA: hypothetical protein VFG12_03635 [Rhodopila sp.]|nr:hypothetical protein [Rhodopila sp.]
MTGLLLVRAEEARKTTQDTEFRMYPAMPPTEQFSGPAIEVLSRPGG